jgi:phosphatidylglycerol:prolipoprotein diacylglycerol transferase
LFPILQIGPLAIQTSGVIIISGIWMGLTLAERFSPTFQKEPNTYANLVFIVIFSGIIGGRITYVFRYIEVFIGSPMNIFSLNPGLLDLSGGIAVGMIAGLIYGNRKSLFLLSTLDAYTFFFGVMFTAIALAQLASGDAYGLETKLPWGIELWGIKRHPTQIYTLLASLAILVILWTRKNSENQPNQQNGSTFFSFTAMSSASRLFLDAFRADSDLIFSSIRTSQLIAWLFLAVSLWGLKKILTNSIQLN